MGKLLYTAVHLYPNMQDRWRDIRCGHEFSLARGKRPLECPGCHKLRTKTVLEALSGPFRFFDDQQEKFVPKILADELLGMNDYMVHPVTDELYVFDPETGIYIDDGRRVAEVIAREELDTMASTRRVSEVIDQMRRTREIMVDEDEINMPREYIVVDNGVLNIETRELMPWDPKIKHIVSVPVKYDPDCRCPKVEEFVGQVVEPDNVPVIQEMFGYCLLREYPFAKAFMMLGGGANGKSTLLNLLTLFLGGGNVATPSLQDLLRNRFAKVELYGKLANIHSDLSSAALYNLGTFKMLTGGDTIRGEMKFVQRTLSFKNCAKLVYSCNKLPLIEEIDEAFLRRWIVIDFPNTFREGEGADPNVLDKMTTPGQMSGLLNWALDGLERLRERGSFTMTKSREDIEMQWLRMSDSIQAFLKEEVEFRSGDFVEKEILYEVYGEYCQDHNLDMADTGMMTRKMRTAFPQARLTQKRVAGKRPRVWSNIRLKNRFSVGDQVDDYDTVEEEDDYLYGPVRTLSEYDD